MSLQLLESQREHYKTIKETLKKNNVCLDTSPLGTGKTFTAAYMVKDYDEVYVISTKTILIKWRTLIDTYSLKSVKETVSFNNIKTNFIKGDEPKRAYKNIKGKVLFIVDESQNFKNNSSQTKSFLKILNGNPNAHFLYLSGSPLDKKIHMTQYLKLFKVVPISTPNIIEDRGGKNRDLYFLGAWTWLKKRGQIYRYYDTPTEEQLYALFMEIFDILSVSMENLKTTKLEIVTEFREVSLKHIQDADLNYAGLVKKTMALENLKLKYMVQDAITELKSGKKVVLFVNYNKSVEFLQEALEKYNPETITGKTDTKDRERILKTFSENNNKLNVIIGNLTVLSTGIDLDDKHGDFPRVGIISPNLNGVTLFQTINRFSRIDTKSDAKVRIYYLVIDGDKEFDYLNVIEKKIRILEHILGKEVLNNKGRNFKRKILTPLSRTPSRKKKSVQKTPSPIKIQKKRGILKRLKKPKARQQVPKRAKFIESIDSDDTITSIDSLLAFL